MVEMLGRSDNHVSEHLPPIELLPYIIKRNRKTIVLERFDTVLDEHGVPDMRRTLARLGTMITYDQEYANSIDLSYANLHHGVYERAKYWRHGKNSPQVKHRESSDVKAMSYIPFHNLAHRAGNEPKMAPFEVMRQRGIELDDTRRLYRLGSAALWLDEMALSGVQAYRTAESYILRHGLRGIKNDLYGKRILPSRNTFLDHLEHCRPGQLGILPDVEMLARLDLSEAVAELGKVAAQRASISIEESTAIIFDASRKATERIAA